MAPASTFREANWHQSIGVDQQRPGLSLAVLQGLRRQNSGATSDRPRCALPPFSPQPTQGLVQSSAASARETPDGCRCVLPLVRRSDAVMPFQAGSLPAGALGPVGNCPFIHGRTPDASLPSHRIGSASSRGVLVAKSLFSQGTPLNGWPWTRGLRSTEIISWQASSR